MDQWALEGIVREIQEIMTKFNDQIGPFTDGNVLLDVRIAQNQALADLLFHHRRRLEFLKGNPVEPMVHEVEAVLVGVLGGGLG